MKKNVIKTAKKWNDTRIIVQIMILLAVSLIYLGFSVEVKAEEKTTLYYFYEEVCATCDGTKEFYELYDRVITPEEKKTLQLEIILNNVFMESCKQIYNQMCEELQIPAGTNLPVVIINDQWISGMSEIESQLHDVLLEQASVVHMETTENTEAEKTETADADWIEQLIKKVENSTESVLLLFTTNACEDCESVKQWIAEQGMSLECTILEANIIEENCLNALKAVFQQYEVPEEEQKVPAAFYGSQYVIQKDNIIQIQKEDLHIEQNNKEMIQMLSAVQKRLDEGMEPEKMNILTLAGAGLLAGFNPCSISMLLMLLSLLISEKASVWKNGLMYLVGKYVAYFSIGLAIFMTASQISDQAMEKAGNVIQIVMAILFSVAAVFYIVDAVKIFKQDYGKIRTQLPVGLRRMNHKLIRKVSSATGVLQPLLILGLGIAISFGEFFCTGQIYMASITYLLKDQASEVWIPFLVYTTAMSIPAIAMIILIQKTRNTNAVSDFMFRHLGAIKIGNAVLFVLFALYFLVF